MRDGPPPAAVMTNAARYRWHRGHRRSGGAEAGRERRIHLRQEKRRRVAQIGRRLATDADVDRPVEPQLIEPPLQPVRREIGLIERVIAAIRSATTG